MHCYQLYSGFISWAQLASLAKTNHSLHRQNLQPNIVSNSKLEILLSDISIALLSALGCKQSLPDDCYSVLTLLNQLWSLYQSIANLFPAQWGPTRMTVQSLKWCHADTCLITVIINELCQGNIHCLTALPIHTTSPQHIF